MLEREQLAQVARRVEGRMEAQVPAVEHFYQLISARNLEAAYAML